MIIKMHGDGYAPGAFRAEEMLDPGPPPMNTLVHSNWVATPEEEVEAMERRIDLAWEIARRKRNAPSITSFLSSNSKINRR